MKKDFFNIEDLAQGRCAVKNDGTLEELREVLNRAFPNDKAKVSGGYKYYEKDKYETRNFWTCDSETDLPTQSVKDFLHDFRVGDLVANRLNLDIGTITDINKGFAKIDYGNGWMSNTIIDNLTPYYKKGDKAEVVEDFVVLSFKKGDIIEFTDDNIINGFRLSDAVLKDKIKRIRSGKLEHDVSGIELKTLNAAKKAIDNATTTTINCNWVEDIAGRIPLRQPERHSHYNNEHGSLYKIAEQLGLNAYEFDILKRIARCRKKGQFKEDLQKIKDTVDLYLKEVEHD